MEKYFAKKSEKRNKEWKIAEIKDGIEEIQSDNLNFSRGDYLVYKQVKSEYARNDIRNYDVVGMIGDHDLNT